MRKFYTVLYLAIILSCMAACGKNDTQAQTPDRQAEHSTIGYPLLFDIGCGPGIYAEKFARQGYYVTGIDFSKRSIDYAKNSALKQGLDISYCRTAN